MPRKQQENQPGGEEKLTRQQMNNLLGEYVLYALGQPGDLQRVHVRPLWEDHYRVNVLVGVDAASARVAHSYFLVVDGDGNIIGSTPEITRQY